MKIIMFPGFPHAESGAVLRWDVSKLPVQDREIVGDDNDDSEDEGEGNEGIYKGDLDWRDEDSYDKTEASKGAPPSDVFFLQVGTEILLLS